MNRRRVGVFSLGILFFVSLLFSQRAAEAQGGAMAAQPGPRMEVVLDPSPVPNMIRVPGPKTPFTPAASTININFINAGGCVWGDPATSGTPANAFRYAADQWEVLLDSAVPITVDATWDNLGGSVLGSAGSTFIWRNFANAPVSNVFFPDALANKFAGSDLNAAADIDATFNCGFTDWYFETDQLTPVDKIDFVQVVMHELGHGLGFSAIRNVSSGQGFLRSGGFPSIYSCYTGTSAASQNRYLLNTTVYPEGSTALGDALVGDDIFFYGAAAQAGNGGSPVELYAPAIWAGGSSYAHLGEVFNDNTNNMMTYSVSFGESLHNPGPVALGIFNDMGWDGTIGDPGNVGEACNDPTAITLNAFQAGRYSGVPLPLGLAMATAVGLMFFLLLRRMSRRQAA